MRKNKIINPEDTYRFNTLAREQMKTKLLNDILLDMTKCQLEGWSIMEYLLELQKLINDIIKKENINKP